jgi:hypothetical protein
MNAIKMPKLVKVKCLNCGANDQANWNQFGADQPCLNCDSAAVYLVKAAN